MRRLIQNRAAVSGLVWAIAVAACSSDDSASAGRADGGGSGGAAGGGNRPGSGGGSSGGSAGAGGMGQGANASTGGGPATGGGGSAAGGAPGGGGTPSVNDSGSDSPSGVATPDAGSCDPSKIRRLPDGPPLAEGDFCDDIFACIVDASRVATLSSMSHFTCNGVDGFSCSNGGTLCRFTNPNTGYGPRFVDAETLARTCQATLALGANDELVCMVYL